VRVPAQLQVPNPADRYAKECPATLATAQFQRHREHVAQRLLQEALHAGLQDQPDLHLGGLDWYAIVMKLCVYFLCILFSFIWRHLSALLGMFNYQPHRIRILCAVQSASTLLGAFFERTSKQQIM